MLEPHADEISGATSSSTRSITKILIADDEIVTGVSNMERNFFTCSAMLKHKKLCDSKNVQGCGDQIATQMGDCSEGQFGALASPSYAAKDYGCYMHSATVATLLT